ncbi:mannitol dehydrogenase family protein [Actinoplanes sp. NPDC023936]|uniref:mannitol dehydrogenase family protein n=1 Tax=Actinoplanes sp. NPDC023936 TaxID=3154910 RepID=UPI0033CC7C96
MLHLGLGNFFRAHQAWYTAAAGDGWDITAFTGRSPGMADLLNAQDCRYTLITRGPAGDEAAVLRLAAAHAGDDRDAWLREWTRPELAVVTLTVTEAAYAASGRRGAVGSGAVGSGTVGSGTVGSGVAGSGVAGSGAVDLGSVPVRLAAGLAARRAAGGGPVAIVSCDNLPANGSVTASVVTEAADPGLRRWIDGNVSFVTTMVDRITPATTDDDRRAAAALTGWADQAPVVTEPYAEWVLSGDFPAGRPAWENAGARFVADVSAYEQRKLWMLNGGHTILAYAGSLRGHVTVADAVADPYCRSLLDQWWDEASAGLPDGPSYRASLVERWSNARIEHRLAQIAADGSMKIPIRIVPVLLRARAAGRMPEPGVQVLAAWIRHLRGESVPVADAGAGPFAAAAGAGEPAGVLRRLDERLGADRDLVAAVSDAL